MIPYLDPAKLALFGQPVPFFPLLVTAGIGAAFELAVRTAPRVGLERAAVASIGLWTIAGGFVGSHLFSELGYYPARVAARPTVLLDVFGSMSSVGAMMGGATAASAAMLRSGMERGDGLRVLDLIAFVTPLGFAFGRLGCALGHDHLGIPSMHSLAVAFPDGARFDLGLLELFVMLSLSALFVALRGALALPGCFVGLYCALYCLARFSLDFLRVDEARYLGWTAAQLVAAPAALLGLVLLARALASSRARSFAAPGSRSLRAE